MHNLRKIGDQKGSKTAILQTLRIQGSISRIELTRLTDLSKATISLAINELLELGLVYETELRLSTGGRPATKLSLATQSHAVLGADLNNNRWVLGAFDLLGNPIHKVRIPIASSSPGAAVQALAEELPKFVKDLNKHTVPLLGLGVPGLVDTQDGMIRSSAVLGWQHVQLGKMVEEAIGWPTVVLNRSRARGLSECRFGSGKPYNHMIYIGVDTGIGAGIYVNRELIHGTLGGAGEIGHTTVSFDGPLCPCGNTGCLQMLSAETAIEQETRRLLRHGSSSSLMSAASGDIQMLKAETICQAANEGDELAVQVIVNAASYLGLTMANLVNALNPDAIILGGWIPMECPLYLQTAEKVMRQRAMSQLATAAVVHPGSFDEVGGALGAANYALDRHLSFSHLYNQQLKA
jgi:predicted NBD/HSP70 family sugar kinase